MQNLRLNLFGSSDRTPNLLGQDSGYEFWQ